MESGIIAVNVGNIPKGSPEETAKALTIRLAQLLVDTHNGLNKQFGEGNWQFLSHQLVQLHDRLLLTVLFSSLKQ